MADAMKLEDVLFFKLKDLILEQSEGEWTDDMIVRDAHHFANNLRPLLSASPPAREEAPDEGAGDEAYNRVITRLQTLADYDFVGLQECVNLVKALRNRKSEPESRMTVIDPDQWEPCTPSWIERHPTGCGQAPRVWCEAESNHYHPVNWKGS